MTNEEFAAWIGGYLALSDEKFLTVSQIKMIKNHADLVQKTVGANDFSALNFSISLENELKKSPEISRTIIEKLAHHHLKIG